jgi:hypothetical protein
MRTNFPQISSCNVHRTDEVLWNQQDEVVIVFWACSSLPIWGLSSRIWHTTSPLSLVQYMYTVHWTLRQNLGLLLLTGRIHQAQIQRRHLFVDLIPHLWYSGFIYYFFFIALVAFKTFKTTRIELDKKYQRLSVKSGTLVFVYHLKVHLH